MKNDYDLKDYKEVSDRIDKTESDFRDLLSYSDKTASEIEMMLCLYQMKNLLNTKPKAIFKYLPPESPLFKIMLDLDLVLDVNFDTYFQKILDESHKKRTNK